MQPSSVLTVAIIIYLPVEAQHVITFRCTRIRAISLPAASGYCKRCILYTFLWKLAPERGRSDRSGQRARQYQSIYMAIYILWQYDDERTRFSVLSWLRRQVSTHFIPVCRMTNHELLRWLVETPSRDVENYHMFTASRSHPVTL